MASLMRGGTALPCLVARLIPHMPNVMGTL